MTESQVSGFLRGSLTAIGTRLFDLPSRYGFHLLVAAKLGVIEAGSFYIVFGTMTVLAGFGRLGLDRMLTRELAVAQAAGRDGDVRRILGRGLRQVTLTSAAASAAMAAAAHPFSAWILHKPDLAAPLMLGALTLLPQNLGAAAGGALSGLHRIGLSQMVYSWLPPALFCLVALAIPLDVERALLLNAAAYGIVALIGGALLMRTTARAGGVPGPMPALLRPGLSLFTLELNQLCISGAPTVILGMTADSRQVGLFALAWRVSLLANVLVSSITGLVSPRFARFHARGDQSSLSRTAAQAVGFGLGLSVLPVAAMLAVPSLLLGLVGKGFTDGEGTLRILAVGQLGAACFTAMPELLGMTGRLADLRRVNLLSLVTLLAAAVMLTPWLASDGAAIATALAILVNGAAAAWAAHRALAITPWRTLFDDARRAVS